jgi:hypothetical protein
MKYDLPAQIRMLPDGGAAGLAYLVLNQRVGEKVQIGRQKTAVELASLPYVCLRMLMTFFQFVQNIFSGIAAARGSDLPEMYGPPQDCKGKVWSRGDKSAQMYSVFVEMDSPDQDELRAYLSFKVGRSQSTISGIRLKTRRCDCSFVRTVPVQTSVGKLLVDHFDVRMKC